MNVELLDDFIKKVASLADLRNVSPINPVIIVVEKPATSLEFTIVGAILEPTLPVIPINATWVVLHPSSAYFKKALKLKSGSAPLLSGIPGVITDGNFTQSWILISDYDEIFTDLPLYSTFSGIKGDQGIQGPKGDQGIQGPKGDQGIQGPKGDSSAVPVVDYQIIIDALIPRIPVVNTITVAGTASIQAPGNGYYNAKVTFTDGTVIDKFPVSWSASPVGVIGTSGAFAVGAGIAVQTAVTITASLTTNSGTVTGSLPVKVLPELVKPIDLYYGVAVPGSVIDSTFVLALAQSGAASTANPLNETFTLTADETQSMFYAYPARLGLAKFLDMSSMQFGGWDGATGDPIAGALGPLTVSVTSEGVTEPYYVYQTDFPGLGNVTWQVSVA